MKPDWLIDAERKKESKKREPGPMCVDCSHFGVVYVKETKHKNKERCTVYECEIHPGCMCTRFSIGCDDWRKDV